MIKSMGDMSEENMSEEENIGLKNLCGCSKYEIVSRTYSGRFEKCCFIVFNNETGELRKEIFELLKGEKG